jgi:flavin reductase (DIM6/NTAB) family NADH-FMN oxidoreductase RutF
VAWFSRVNYKPPMIAVALGKRHFTNSGINENKAFSVNIPGVDLVKETDYCGLVSGSEADKSRVFEVFYGELKTAPMIAQCPVCMECKLAKTVDLDMDTLFIGEIAAVYSEARYLTGGKLDTQKIKPFMLTMPDNYYFGLGEKVAQAWSVGRQK